MIGTFINNDNIAIKGNRETMNKVAGLMHY